MSEYIHGLYKKGTRPLRVLPKSAVTMSKRKMNAFMYQISLDIQERRRVTKLRMRVRRAMYAFASLLAIDKEGGWGWSFDCPKYHHNPYKCWSGVLLHLGQNLQNGGSLCWFSVH